MNRVELEHYILENYNSESGYPWLKYPNYQVFRHCNNQKWFALIMDVPKNKLGIQDEDILDVVNFKCNPILISLLEDSGNTIVDFGSVEASLSTEFAPTVSVTVVSFNPS